MKRKRFAKDISKNTRSPGTAFGGGPTYSGGGGTSSPGASSPGGGSTGSGTGSTGSGHGSSGGGGGGTSWVSQDPSKPYYGQVVTSTPSGQITTVGSGTGSNVRSSGGLAPGSSGSLPLGTSSVNIAGQNIPVKPSYKGLSPEDYHTAITKYNQDVQNLSQNVLRGKDVYSTVINPYTGFTTINGEKVSYNPNRLETVGDYETRIYAGQQPGYKSNVSPYTDADGKTKYMRTTELMAIQQPQRYLSQFGETSQFGNIATRNLIPTTTPMVSFDEFNRQINPLASSGINLLGPKTTPTTIPSATTPSSEQIQAQKDIMNKTFGTVNLLSPLQNMNVATSKTQGPYLESPSTVTTFKNPLTTSVDINKITGFSLQNIVPKSSSETTVPEFARQTAVILPDTSNQPAHISSILESTKDVKLGGVFTSDVYRKQLNDKNWQDVKNQLKSGGIELTQNEKGEYIIDPSLQKRNQDIIDLINKKELDANTIVENIKKDWTIQDGKIVIPYGTDENKIKKLNTDLENYNKIIKDEEPLFSENKDINFRLERDQKKVTTLFNAFTDAEKKINSDYLTKMDEFYQKQPYRYAIPGKIGHGILSAGRDVGYAGLHPSEINLNPVDIITGKAGKATSGLITAGFMATGLGEAYLATVKAAKYGLPILGEAAGVFKATEYGGDALKIVGLNTGNILSKGLSLTKPVVSALKSPLGKSILLAAPYGISYGIEGSRVLRGKETLKEGILNSASSTGYLTTMLGATMASEVGGSKATQLAVQKETKFQIAQKVKQLSTEGIVDAKTGVIKFGTENGPIKISRRFGFGDIDVKIKGKTFNELGPKGNLISKTQAMAEWKPSLSNNWEAVGKTTGVSSGYPETGKSNAMLREQYNRGVNFLRDSGLSLEDARIGMNTGKLNMVKDINFRTQMENYIQENFRRTGALPVKVNKYNVEVINKPSGENLLSTSGVKQEIFSQPLGEGMPSEFTYAKSRISSSKPVSITEAESNALKNYMMGKDYGMTSTDVNYWTGKENYFGKEKSFDRQINSEIANVGGKKYIKGYTLTSAKAGKGFNLFKVREGTFMDENIPSKQSYSTRKPSGESGKTIKISSKIESPKLASGEVRTQVLESPRTKTKMSLSRLYPQETEKVFQASDTGQVSRLLQEGEYAPKMSLENLGAMGSITRLISPLALRNTQKSSLRTTSILSLEPQTKLSSELKIVPELTTIPETKTKLTPVTTLRMTPDEQITKLITTPPPEMITPPAPTPIGSILKGPPIFPIFSGPGYGLGRYKQSKSSREFTVLNPIRNLGKEFFSGNNRIVPESTAYNKIHTGMNKMPSGMNNIHTGMNKMPSGMNNNFMKNNFQGLKNNLNFSKKFFKNKW